MREGWSESRQEWSELREGHGFARGTRFCERDHLPPSRPPGRSVLGRAPLSDLTRRGVASIGRRGGVILEDNCMIEGHRNGKDVC